MLTKPSFDEKIITQKIENTYGIRLKDVTFIPVGECSWGYKIETDSNEMYFLKIHTGLDNIEERFNVTYRLYNECGIKQITHPLSIPGTKDLVFYIDQFPCALFNFIDGSIAADNEFNSIQKFELGALIGRIHTATKSISNFNLVEKFQYKYIDRLLSNIEYAKAVKNSKDPITRQTAELLLIHYDAIKERIDELDLKGIDLKNTPIDFVICHGEPHIWNTMTDSHGTVYLIDWDDSILAPKEKDLRMVMNHAEVLEGYQSVTGSLELNQEVLTYYDFEWNLSEIDAWSNDIFFANRNHTQNEYYLKHLQDDLQKLHKKYT